MGRDKWELELGGERLLDRAVRLARSQTDEVYLSVAFRDQRDFGLPVIRDLEESPGPLGGLQAAFDFDSETCWLLIACDLPRVREEDVSSLVGGFEEGKDVCCFVSPLDGEAEPLFALYGPGAQGKLENSIREGRRCARRFLAGLDRVELEAGDPQMFLNLNRPEHLEELRRLEEVGVVEKEVEVEYFAKLSEEAGRDVERCRTSAATLAGLWEELRLRYGFSLDLPHVKAAVDDEFADWGALLSDGMKIALMPPFAGG